MGKGGRYPASGGVTAVALFRGWDVGCCLTRRRGAVVAGATPRGDAAVAEGGR